MGVGGFVFFLGGGGGGGGCVVWSLKVLLLTSSSRHVAPRYIIAPATPAAVRVSDVLPSRSLLFFRIPVSRKRLFFPTAGLGGSSILIFDRSLPEHGFTFSCSCSLIICIAPFSGNRPRS